MKKILAGLVLLGSISAFAGLPGEDQTIATLRSDFYDGQQIDRSTITGKTFRCTGYSAVKNNFDQEEFRVSFEEFGNDLRQRYTPGDRKHPSVIEDYYTSDRVVLSKNVNTWGGSYLVSDLSFLKVYAYVSYRINDHGELLQEFSAKRIALNSWGLDYLNIETLSPLTNGLEDQFKVNQYSRCFIEL
jgi:hypothetical protein